jgi:signal transduction histidine kinase
MPEVEKTIDAAKGETFAGELLIKSTHLIYFRMGFALVSLVVSAVVGWLAGTQEQPVGVFYIAGGVVVYTSLALLVVKNGLAQRDGALKIVDGCLLGLDIIALSALVQCTHGVESDLYFLYLLPIVLASHTFGRRGILVTAFSACLAYAVVLGWEGFSLLPFLLGDNTNAGLKAAYSRRLWERIFTHIAMLAGVSFVWALFCEYMSHVAQQGATRLRGQLTANNRLMLETTAQAAREQMMNAIASAIRSTLDIDQILSTTVSQLITAVRASRCAIITPADAIGQPPLIWEASREGEAHEHDHDNGFSRPLCEFMLDNLAHYVDLDDGSMKKTFVYDDPLKEPFFVPVKEELHRLRFRSLLVQPITYAGDSKGVILIGECEREREWADAECELIKAVSAQVSIAIEHARLVDQLSRKNRDLLQKNLNLDSKNLELRTVQSQLIHQEKMASLGRMVAGIAHELNNPINFVHGNLPYLREYFEDLKKIIAEVDRLPDESRAPVDALKQKVKYDFLVTDLDNIIADLAEGADRIRQIIKNLRSFSRLDEAELKEASIQEGIESTIKILNQYYGRDKIQADCKFDEIPPVVCYPGKLNQVWMNLLSNAAEAVHGLEHPVVSLRAQLDGDWVLVSIMDNGTGIKAQDQSKIFEPFYTTKPVGQGTGLGLSICHSIIERHGGSIWFDTSPKGTIFKVKIPLKAEPENLDEGKQPGVGASAVPPAARD